MDARRQRGLLIAKTGRVDTNGRIWFVPAGSRPGVYRVDLRKGSCACADFEESGLACKHIFAAKFTAEFAADPLSMPDASEIYSLERVTYRQDWPRYTRAQCGEKGMVQALLQGLCDSIVQPPYRGRGRPPLPLADVVFGCTMKVFGGMSGRRSTTDFEEHRAQGRIDHAPHFNSIGNYLAREELTSLLTSLIETSASPLAGIEHDFSIDATGFSTTTYDRWFDKKWGRETKRQKWLKLHASVGNETNIIAAVTVTDGDDHDSPEMPGLVQRTAQRFDVREVQGDKAYLSHANLEAIEAVGARPFVPFKSNSTPDGGTNGKGSDAWRRMWLMCQLNREEYLAHYHRRSNAEATFSALKRKFGSSIRSKKRTAQVNEVLCKVLCYNLSVLTRAIYDLGIETGFMARAAEGCGSNPSDSAAQEVVTLHK